MQNSSGTSHLLFIYGFARSGTTYFANLLERVFDYGIGPEGTFIKTIYDRRRAFGDVTEPRNMARLLDNLSRSETFEIIRKRYPKEQQFDVTPEELAARLDRKSIAGALEAALRCLADFQGRSKLGTKCPDFGWYLPILEELFGTRAKYICIVRDARDVFLSLQSVPWGGQSAYVVAKKWREYARATDRFLERVGPERLLVVRYKDILQDMRSVLFEIKRFLGDDMDSRIFDNKIAAEKTRVVTSNADKWKTLLSKSDKRCFDAVASEQLAAHGYDQVCESRKLNRAEVSYFELRELLRLVRINMYHLANKLPGDLRRR